MKIMKHLTVLTLIIASVLTLITVGMAYANVGGLLDQEGNTAVDSLKKLARGGLGKAIFAGALLVGIVLLLSPKHKFFGAIAVAFGILLGLYGGLVESLWGWITSMGGSSQ